MKKTCFIVNIETNMKKTNVIKPLVLCLFCLLAFAGCQKKYPSVYEYTGVWDFTIQLDLEDPPENYSNVFVADTIINYTGRIAHAGGGLLLIEFNQNECMEVYLTDEGKLLEEYPHRNRYYSGYFQYYGRFLDCNHVEMFFHTYHYVTTYKVKGTKVK